MVGADPEPAPREPHPELEEAPRIAARDDLGAGLDDSVELPLQEPLSDPGLHQVVDAGRAAAEVRLRQFPELEPRDRAEQDPRRLSHALAVSEAKGECFGTYRLASAPGLKGRRNLNNPIGRCTSRWV